MTTKYRRITDGDFLGTFRGLPGADGRTVLDDACILRVLLTETKLLAWAKITIVTALVCLLDVIPGVLPAVACRDALKVLVPLVRLLGSFVTDDVRERARYLAGRGRGG